MALHEFGHFLLAKKFGVLVEEFGIGYPPKIYGKKFGETIYSLNLLPFGAFVRILGTDEKVEHPRSFSEIPLFQRVLIILGGVVSFWIIAFLIFSFVAGVWGLPTVIPDDFKENALRAEVQIVQVFPDSPAEKTGLEMGDVILELKVKNDPEKVSSIFNEAGKLKIDKTKQVQDFIGGHLGQDIILTIKRGKEILDITLNPRVSPPEGEGAIGVSLARVTRMRYSWYRAPLVGASLTGQKTIEMPLTLGMILKRLLQGEKVKEVKIVGPIGIGTMMVESIDRGFDNFLLFVGILSVWLAFSNLLPIPALDGGKLLFLIIEKFKGVPVNEKLEKNITTFFFAALVILMIFVTIRDIINIF